MLIAASGFAQWNLISNQDTLIRYYDVAITPDSTVFVCGRDSFSGILIRSQDLGSTWDTTTFSDECYDISFPTNSIGYAKVYPGNLYKTIDGGNSWILIYDSLIASPSGDLLFINQDTGFSSYQDGGAGFFRTFDGGITWNQIIDTSLSDGLKNIGGRKMVFNNGNLYNTGGDFYLKSSDYGDHWQAFINDSIINSNNTISVWNDSIWLAGMGAGGIHFNHGIICRPTNGGLPWNFIDYQQFVFFQDMEMISSLKGYLVGIVYDYDYAFMKTIDGGNSWTLLPSGTTIHLYSISFPTENVGYAVGENSNIFKTKDNGANWTLISYGGYDLFSVSFIDPSHGIVAGDYTTLLKTSDGGLTWDYLSGGEYGWFLSVYMTDTNTAYVAGGAYQWGLIYKVKDNLMYPLTCGVKNWLLSVHFPNASTGYVVGRGGTIFKTDNGGGPVGISEMEPDSNSLKLYPNPTSGDLTIETVEKGTLFVFDLNGVLLLQRELTERTTTIDVNTLPGGVYFVKMVGVKGVQVGKFVKQ